MGEAILKAEGLTKRYGALDALRDVSFSLERGQVLGLFGRNGSGKSTLLDILALAARPDAGRVFFSGTEADFGTTALRRRIGYVPQEIALFEELTVRENLLCWSRLPGKQAKARADELADTLNLREFYTKKVSALSGGMKRRVNLAVALLGEPELLILDEPFAGVDADNTDWLSGYLRARADDGVAQIISGHSPEMLLPILDRMLVLSGGSTIWYGTREAFLGEAESLGANRRMQSLIRGEGL